MKKVFATVSLIILNIIAFSAALCSAFVAMVSIESRVAAIAASAIFLVAFPFPQVFVWRFFRDRYGFGKKKFFLCTILPSYIITTILGAVLTVLGGPPGLVFLFGCHAATLCLIIGTAVWISVGGRLEKTTRCKAKKPTALILLGVCGTIICGRLHGLLYVPFAELVPIVRSDKVPFLVSYMLGILCLYAVLAIPLGFGVSALMSVYRREFSVKAPLFMLCAFAPRLLISGVATAVRYTGYRETEYHFFHTNFNTSLEALIFTAALAIISAIIYAISALIRRKSTIDTP